MADFISLAYRLASRSNQDGLGLAGMRGLNVALAERLGRPASTAAASLSSPLPVAGKVQRSEIGWHRLCSDLRMCNTGCKFWNTCSSNLTRGTHLLRSLLNAAMARRAAGKPTMRAYATISSCTLLTGARRRPPVVLTSVASKHELPTSTTAGSNPMSL